MSERAKGFTRRQFLGTTAGGVAAGLSLGAARTGSAGSATMPRRRLGRTGLSLSVLGFGGGSQFQKNRDGKWEPLLERAVEEGVNYFDTASGYGFGGKQHSEIRFGEILPKYRERVYICTKFNPREPDGMMKEVEESLGRLRTDYVDFLMLHSIEKSEDVAVVEQGVWARMRQLKEEGTARFIGFSSMNSADKSKEIIEKLHPDVALLAVNPTQYGRFAEIALPAARAKNVGVMAMKVVRNLVGVDGTTAEELMGYSLGQDGVSSAVIGHAGIEVFEENVRLSTRLAERPATAVARERAVLETRLAAHAGPHTLPWARSGYRDRWA